MLVDNMKGYCCVLLISNLGMIMEVTRKARKNDWVFCLISPLRILSWWTCICFTAARDLLINLCSTLRCKLMQNNISHVGRNKRLHQEGGGGGGLGCFRTDKYKHEHMYVTLCHAMSCCANIASDEQRERERMVLLTTLYFYQIKTLGNWKLI